MGLTFGAGTLLGPRDEFFYPTLILIMNYSLTFGARTLLAWLSTLLSGLEDKISSKEEAVDSILIEGSGSVTDDIVTLPCNKAKDYNILCGFRPPD